MPMQSQSQRAYLWIHHPKIAKEFEASTPKKKLPRYKYKGKFKNRREYDEYSGKVFSTH